MNAPFLKLLAIAMFAAFSPLCQAKEDPAAKAEAEQIAKEEAEALRLGSESKSPLVYFDARGKLSLFSSDDPQRKNDVVGIFTSDKGTYLVKCPNPESMKLIAAYDKKDVTLTGKLRAEGKYFVVDGVAGGGAPPVAKTNKRRI